MHECPGVQITPRWRIPPALAAVLVVALTAALCAQSGSSAGPAAIPDSYYAVGNRVDVRAPIQGMWWLLLVAGVLTLAALGALGIWMYRHYERSAGAPA